ncbi:MAG: hypothetical protein ACQEVA_04575 [Myxococcota bacterium]
MSLGLLLSGCGKPWQDPGPDDTFETFLLDLYSGNRQAAFDALRQQDRERLTKALEELEGEVPEDALPDRTQMLVTGRVDNPYDFKDIEYEEEFDQEPKEGTVVKLQLVYHDGREGQARVIWGGDRWYVDLPEATERSEGSPVENGERERARKRGAEVASGLIDRLRAEMNQREAKTGSDGAGAQKDTSGEQ